MSGRSPEVARQLRHGTVAPTPRRRGAATADRLQVAFALLVLAYFAAQIVRGLIQQGALG